MIPDLDKSITRRKLLNVSLAGIGLGWLAAVFYPVWRYLIPPEQAEAEPDSLKLGPASDFAPGTSKMFKFGRKPAMLIRDLKGEFHALAATCTHLDCIVQYRKEEDGIWCACHNGRYDLSGKNVSGPPPRPLDRYAVRISDGEVVVVRNA